MRVHMAALAVAFSAMAGCTSKAPPARPAPAPAPVAAPASQPEVKPASAEQAWTYTSVGKRDPFRSFLVDAAMSNNASAITQCSTPLGRFEIDQLKVVAVVTGLEDPVAMVEAPNGIGYRLRRGSCVGRNGGVVSTVRTGEVVVSEWIVRADGTRERTQTLLRLPQEAPLNIEE